MLKSTLIGEIIYRPIILDSTVLYSSIEKTECTVHLNAITQSKK